MIAKLCQRIQPLAKNKIEFHPISKGVRYPVKIVEINTFLGKLGGNDLDLFKKRSTFSLEDRRRDERAVVIPFENPIIIEDTTIFALRLKGVFPQASQEGDVVRYINGRGFSSRMLEPTSGTSIMAKTERSDSEYSALGTMSFETLETEVETALVLGSERTDLLLGFGIYEDLSFNGKPVGFAIYGMERKEDTRIFSYLSKHIMEKGRLPDAEDLALHTGNLLREMHELKFGHKSPHLGNYGLLLSQRESRILDLESSIKLSSVPEENRLAFLYLDLSRIINDYQKAIIYNECYDGENEEHIIPSTALLPFFFWGYFKEDASLPFIKALQRFMDGNYKPYELSETFGILPEFGDGWRRGSNFTLIEPTIQLYTLPENGWIDLKKFRSRPFFNLFFEALESVALSI